MATLVDGESPCPHSHFSPRFNLGCGLVVSRDPVGDNSHGLRLWNCVFPAAVPEEYSRFTTVDAQEAEEAFALMESWVRTGEWKA